jgi:hypothetical protein
MHLLTKGKSLEPDYGIQWVLRMPDPHHRIRPSLKSIVEELGHEDLAYYI